MSYYEYETFKLPTIDFVGGEQQDLIFSLLDNEGDPFYVSNYTAKFAVQAYTNPTGTVLISKDMSPYVQTQGAVSHAFQVTLSPSDTVSLSGKYIYQITILNNLGKATSLSQGIMYISQNIAPSHVS